MAIITDLDPLSNPGANLVAFEFAKVAAQEFQTEFWTSGRTTISENYYDYDFLSFKYINLTERFIKFPSRGLRHKTIREIFSIKPLRWIFIRLFIFRPNLIWVHQIGNVFPYSMFILFRLFRIPAVFTLHDFGTLVPRKLYPADLGLNQKDLFNFHTSNFGRNHMTSSLHLGLSARYSIRLLIIRLLLRSVRLVSISNLQAEILKANRIPIFRTIANGVNPCNCEGQVLERELAILFAGRLSGKGFTHVLRTVESHPTLKLHLAGEKQLLSQARLVLPDSRIAYHGTLNSHELFKVMHRVRFLAALSDCFDVYPSIVLEALAHGCIPFCYPTVGNASLAAKVHKKLVIDYGYSIDDKLMNELAKNSVLLTNAIKIGKSQPSFFEAYKNYRIIFNSNAED